MRRQQQIVLLVFLAAQVLDGGLTYAGLRQFGTAAEGNGLLMFYIEAFGPVTALVGAKAFASACGLILYLASFHRPLAVAAGGYLGLAVVPWLLALVALS